MQTPARTHTGVITETIRGIVDRVTYHNPDNGWSVLRVLPFNNPHQQETVIVHQTKVFAGATMEFHGAWTKHPKFGRQFKATKAVERKPATTAALEKYLGSGLIKGVGPKTAKKIVNHFGKETLEIFEGEIEKLTEIKGIAQKKLETIKDAWIEHRALREALFLRLGFTKSMATMPLNTSMKIHTGYPMIFMGSDFFQLTRWRKASVLLWTAHRGSWLR